MDSWRDGGGDGMRVGVITDDSMKAHALLSQCTLEWRSCTRRLVTEQAGAVNLDCHKNHCQYDEYVGSIFLHFQRVLSYPTHISIILVCLPVHKPKFGRVLHVAGIKKGYPLEHSSLPPLPSLPPNFI